MRITYPKIVFHVLTVYIVHGENDFSELEGFFFLWAVPRRGRDLNLHSMVVLTTADLADPNM